MKTVNKRHDCLVVHISDIGQDRDFMTDHGKWGKKILDYVGEKYPEDLCAIIDINHQEEMYDLPEGASVKWDLEEDDAHNDSNTFAIGYLGFGEFTINIKDAPSVYRIYKFKGVWTQDASPAYIFISLQTAKDLGGISTYPFEAYYWDGRPPEEDEGGA